MSGILVYPPSEAVRNEYVVRRFTESLGVKTVAPDYRGDADFVINRSNDPAVATHYESRGIRVFNPSGLTRIANDKQLCYDYLGDKGVPVLPTRYGKPPFVKKPRDGKGGQGVVMCHSADEYDENMVCQQPASVIGKDLRVWVLGGEIRCAILRSSDHDFRANYCLGGSAELHELTPDERAVVESVISLVQGDYYGVDLLYHNGGIVLNEIEDTVGARMIYDLTDIDIIGEYIEYIKSNLS